MKGGIFLESATTYKENIYQMVLNGNVQLMPVASTGGFLFTVDVDESFNTNLIQVFPTFNTQTNNPNNPLIPVKSIIIKLVLLDDRATINALVNFNFEGSVYNKEIVTSQTFLKECSIQKTIYTASLDATCDPICLYPIYCNIARIGGFTNQTNVMNVIYNAMANKSRLFNYIINRVNTGIMVMQNFNNSQPVSSYFPGWSPSNTYENYNYFSTYDDDKFKVMMNYLYALCRLKQIGYIHEDVHLGNALCVNNTGYMYDKKVFLIDFGRTTPDYNPGSNNIIDISINHWSYLCFKEFYKTILGGKTCNVGQICDFNGKLCNSDNKCWLPARIDNNSRIKSIADFLQVCREFKNMYILNFIKSVQIVQNLRTNLTILFQYNNSHFNLRNSDASWWVFKPAGSVLNSHKMFTRAGIDSQNVNGALDARINYNPECNCCYNINYTTAGQIGYSLGTVQAIISNYPAYIEITCDTDLLTSEAPNGKKIYRLWIIGSGIDNVVHLYTIKIKLCSEIATKHCHLVQYAKIQNLYAAGEMIYTHNLDNSHAIEFNLLSGTYMFSPYINKYNNDMAKFELLMTTLSDISTLFIRNMLYIGNIITVVYNDDKRTYISRANFCQEIADYTIMVTINNILLSLGKGNLYNQFDSLEHCLSPAAGGKLNNSKSRDKNLKSSDKNLKPIEKKLKIIEENKKYDFGDLKNELMIATYELNSFNNNDDYFNVTEEFIAYCNESEEIKNNMNSIYNYTLLLKSNLSDLNTNLYLSNNKEEGISAQDISAQGISKEVFKGLPSASLPRASLPRATSIGDSILGGIHNKKIHKRYNKKTHKRYNKKTHKRYNKKYNKKTHKRYNRKN
jgi:hypothetical protein